MLVVIAIVPKKNPKTPPPNKCPIYKKFKRKTKTNEGITIFLIIYHSQQLISCFKNNP